MNRVVIWEKLTISPMTDASPLGIYIHSPSHTHLMAGNGLPSPLRCPLTVLSEWNVKSSHQWPRSGQHWASNLTTYGIKKILLSWEPEISIHVSSFFFNHFSIYSANSYWVSTVCNVLTLLPMLLLLLEFSKCQKINIEQDPLGSYPHDTNILAGELGIN